MLKHVPKWIDTDDYDTYTSRKPQKSCKKLDKSTSTLNSWSEKMAQSLYFPSNKNKSELE